MLHGNLGRDPELRYTPQGVAVANFSIAVNKRGRGEDQTTWFRVTCWRIVAENVDKYLRKGDPCIVFGTLSMSEWTDRDGVNRTTLEVDATDVHFVNTGGGGDRQDDYADEGSHARREKPDSTPSHTGGGFNRPARNDDDIPF